MNELQNYYFNNKNKKCSVNKWHHYFNIYEKHLNRYKGKNPIILEIGVAYGGSLEMWNHYFGGQCTIYGIDINPECLKYKNILNADNINILLGNQEDTNFWDNFIKDAPMFDIVIDDGGHTMKGQITTFEKIYDKIKKDGIYLCEDLHTSYMNEFGGAYKKSDTFIEYSKNFIDLINAYWWDCPDKSFRQKTHSITYYDSVIVLEKNEDLEKPQSSFQSATV
jgi:hypothetical protein